jgi:hypothetical protein
MLGFSATIGFIWRCYLFHLIVVLGLLLIFVCSFLLTLGIFAPTTSE